MLVPSVSNLDRFLVVTRWGIFTSCGSSWYFSILSICAAADFPSVSSSNCSLTLLGFLSTACLSVACLTVLGFPHPTAAHWNVLGFLLPAYTTVDHSTVPGSSLLACLTVARLTALGFPPPAVDHSTLLGFLQPAPSTAPPSTVLGFLLLSPQSVAQLNEAR